MTMPVEPHEEDFEVPVYIRTQGDPYTDALKSLREGEAERREMESIAHIKREKNKGVK
jgi:hypothetical protein